MPASALDSPLDARLAEVRDRLTRAPDYDAAFVALSRADTETLRALEEELAFLPGPAATLRERLAAAHVARVRGKVAMTTRRVTPKAVARWAVDAVWFGLNGSTDLEDIGQYRISPDPVMPQLFEVTTLAGTHPRRFLVTVGVQELV